MAGKFGIATLVALLAVTRVNAQVQAQLQQQQVVDLTLAVGQMAGEGQEWAITQYQGYPVQWGQWGLWGRCVGTCGLGLQRRQRICYGERLVSAGGAVQVPLDTVGTPVPGTRQAQVPYTGPGCFGYIVEAMGCQLLPCTPSYGNWADWGLCSVSCGGGVQSRTRPCLGNNQCNPSALVETQPCNIQPCQVVLVWGAWTDWGTCTSPCGGGTQTRSRNCLSGSCPTVGSTDTRLCNTQGCAAVWGLWGIWGQCTAPCGGGTQFRTRSCASSNCPPSQNTQYQTCNTAPCGPQWGNWLGWTVCTLTCGGGTQSRTRPCLSGNCQTDSANENRQCNVVPCPSVGFWGEWSQFSVCTATCGGGTYTKTRVCIGSRLCSPGFDTESFPCNTAACVANWGSWSTYSLCNRECGGGTKVRTRVCPQPGACTGSGVDTQTCNDAPCTTYAWSQWQPFGRCSATCGQGTYTRSRVCLENGFPSGNVVGCTALGDVGGASETQYCYAQACVTFSWSSWGQWQGCSANCGSGKQKRERQCLSNGAVTSSQACSSLAESSTQERDCNLGPCYTYGRWGAWGRCSANCGRGTEIRARPCLAGGSQVNLLPGQACGTLPGPLSESRPCFLQSCYSWSSWSVATCSVTCGVGVARKVRVCRGSNGNQVDISECPNVDGGAVLEQACQAQACVIISWSAWGVWQGCTKSCGGGKQMKERSCLSNGQAVSYAVCDTVGGSYMMERACNIGPCYSLGDWRQWSSCSATCGPGSQTRVRSCLADFIPVTLLPGQPCGGITDLLFETRSCIIKGCCSWSEWSAPSCSVTCGSGTATRVRGCQDANGNTVENSCCANAGGTNLFTEACRLQPCLSYGIWGEWRGCSKSCGGGMQQRMRACLANGQVVADGACDSIFGDYMDERDCNVDPCYSLGAWRDWSLCSVSCGPGSQTRIRSCLANGVPITLTSGQSCGTIPDSLFETRSCLERLCCSWSEWSAPSCSVTCGSGTATRVRGCLDTNGNTVENSCCANAGGTNEFTEACRLQPCVSYGRWGAWQGCSRSCGGGKQQRMRPCLANAQVVDNADCVSIFGSYMEERDCNFEPCYSVGAWRDWTVCSATCGPGSQTRTRPCLANGAPVTLSTGQRCSTIPDPLFETRSCAVRQCCAWSEWSPPSCSVTCGSGTATRVRSCEDRGNNRVEDSCCARQGGTNVFREACRLQSCSQLTLWGQWSSCSLSCGGGIARRQRLCLSDDVAVSPDVCGETIDDVIEERACQTSPCYSWSLWSSYSTCSASCGEGQHRRLRGCVAPDGSVAPGPNVCPDPSGLGSVQIRTCRIQACYNWQSWSQSTCSVTCGMGVATKIRRCTSRDGKIPPPGAVGCSDPRNEGSTFTGPCNVGPCYSWTSWSGYTVCSSSCGAGQQFRSRRCAAPGGANAPDVTFCEDILKIGTTESRPCAGSRDGCFELGPWQTWSRCTSSCGQGTITRIRSCQSLDGVQAPKSACVGYKDEDFLLRGTCVRPACPGVYGLWGSWGPCSQSCNAGTKIRTRTCQGGGSCVGVDRDIETCNQIPCGIVQISGTWSVWGNWGSCTRPCGGTRSKTRRCIGGKKPSDCGDEDYVRTITCNLCGPAVVPTATVIVTPPITPPFTPSITPPVNTPVLPSGSCNIKEEDRRRCLVDDVPNTCRIVGCCYQPSTTSGVPACYHRGA